MKYQYQLSVRLVCHNVETKECIFDVTSSEEKIFEANNKNEIMEEVQRACWLADDIADGPGGVYRDIQEIMRNSG